VLCSLSRAWACAALGVRWPSGEARVCVWRSLGLAPGPVPVSKLTVLGEPLHSLFVPLLALPSSPLGDIGAGQHIDDGGQPVTAKGLTPAQLLSCLSRADVVCIDMADFAMTSRGVTALGVADIAPGGTLLQLLAGNAN
jgi:hypothetical protein